ncbi:phosphatases II [Hypoxylon fuscum]|nr:phosphatases II [Hypoxylon fuscum]
MEMDSTPTYRHGARPVAPYSLRAPSPPQVVIPTPALQDANDFIRVVPSYDNVDPASLSIDDLKVITQNHRVQAAYDPASSWSYSSRRTAQPILDFVYLGPLNLARDKEWLRANGITLLLAARQEKQANIQLMTTNKVAQELGIQSAYVDVIDNHELAHTFPSAVRTINNHMLSIYRGQRLSDPDLEVGDGEMVIPNQSFRRGKVLVFCETGNDRSAGIVVAYLMAVFGLTMVEACQFVVMKRFCVGINDELKFLLRAYEDLLYAQRTVHRHQLYSGTDLVKSRKRRIDDTVGEDAEMGGADGTSAQDQERFSGRESFAPFIDQ